MRSKVLSITLFALSGVLIGGCLGRATDDTSEIPQELAVGNIELELFPVGTIGVSALGPYCQSLFSCGCPELAPDDLGWCRDEVRHYTESDCESMLQLQIPECLDE